MDVCEVIMTRRSTRRYTQQPIDEETLRTIIEAGRYAPSGCNNQMIRLLVITDLTVIDRLQAAVSEVLADKEKVTEKYTSMNAAIRKAKKGIYRFAYDAPVLIILVSRADYSNALPDAACMIENMMLMANALDLGSCWVNQLRWLQDEPLVRSTLTELGLGFGEAVFGSVVIGHADTEDGLPVRTKLSRTGNPVERI